MTIKNERFNFIFRCHAHCFFKFFRETTVSESSQRNSRRCYDSVFLLDRKRHVIYQKFLLRCQPDGYGIFLCTIPIGNYHP